MGPGPCHLLLPAEVGKSGVQEDEEEEMESANVDAGGHEDGGATTPYATANAGGISRSRQLIPRAPFHHVHASRQTPTASPFLILIYLSQVRMILLPASTSTRRRLAAKPCCVESGGGRSKDEELMAMDVPEPTKPSHEPSKQSGLYGHYKDKVVLCKLGRESDAGTGSPSLGSQ